MNFTKVLLTVGALALSAGAASAATCDTGDVVFNLTQTGGSPTTDACGFGNDEGNGGWGKTNGWDLTDSSPSDDGGSGFDLILSGNTWSITGADGYDAIAIAFKQSTSYVVFMLDMVATLSGEWSIAGPSRSVMVFSHVNGWTTGSPSEVPLPASALLLLGGLGGLAAMRRHKKA